MKKLILTTFTILFAHFSWAQCVPNTSIVNPGIYPDSATGLAPGTVNSPYNQIIQIKVPTDTVAQTPLGQATVNIDSITLLAFSNLPPGISYACNPPTCKFVGGSNGCVLLSGTPTQSGTFVPIAITSTKGKVAGLIPITQIDTVDYYVINITTPTGIANQNASKFNLLPNEPNPFNTFTNITFTSPIESIVTLKIFNLIGKEILHKQIRCSAGKNTYRIETLDYPAGVYMYTLTDGINTYTRKMINSKR
jgi:hypothetical protein